MKKKKEFDCVQMKDRIQAEIQKEMAGMTQEERLAYWAKETAIMREEQKAAQALRKAS